MYLIIPSIELIEHRSRWTIVGEKGTEKFYTQLSDMPEQLCKLFRLENVKSIQVTDVDSFIDYENNNIDNICMMTEATFLPFQALTNCQTVEDCVKLLEYGVHRIIISDFAINNTEEIKELIREYSDRRIIFSLPVDSEKVIFKHSGVQAGMSEYAGYLKSLGATRVVYSRSEKSLNLMPDKRELDILKKYFPKWTYMHDVYTFSELEELKELMKYNMDSLILGDSFYHTHFPCQKIWRLVEAKLDAAKDEIIAD
jgi:phosphoribosylformimino-5-aminoimidazole carboxamide ribonucleotide (ProFAR) isomerase